MVIKRVLQLSIECFDIFQERTEKIRKNVGVFLIIFIWNDAVFILILMDVL